jgi:hypothetical protein
VALALPVVVMGPEAGLEILHPMAVAVAGGAVTSLLVALFLLPMLYLWLARPAKPPDQLFLHTPSSPDLVAAASGAGPLSPTIQEASQPTTVFRRNEP